MLTQGLADPDEPSGFVTSVKPYAVSVSPGYVAVPIISVGDRVPLSGGGERQFQLIGVPDGLGAYQARGEGTVLFMNHELAGTTSEEPVVGDSLYRGAFISRLVLNRQAEVLSGSVAYDQVIDPNGNSLPPVRVDNTTPAFWRFCSGTLAWRDAGFDRPIYLCGEENAAPNTFDKKGGLAVALVDRTLYTLPHLGHFQHENLPVRPAPTRETVLMLLEDNAGPNSQPFQAQLYMYVGAKQNGRGLHPLVKNGLVGGRIYVFASTTPGVNTEAQLQSGSVTGTWVELQGVEGMNESQLEAASQAVGAFGFVKTEDGAWSKSDPNEFFFNTTGDTLNSVAVGNHLGRTYRLQLDARNLVGPATLSVIYNADRVVAAGGDIALTPDNMDTSREYLMVCEDGTGFSRTVMGNKGRDGLIWRYDLKNG